MKTVVTPGRVMEREGKSGRTETGVSRRVGLYCLQFSDFGKEMCPCLCFTSSWFFPLCRENIFRNFINSLNYVTVSVWNE